MILLLSLLSILMAVHGVYRSYKKRNMIIFIWLIVTYYSLTSLVAILSPSDRISGVQFVSIETKTIYTWSMFLCLMGFTISDLLFNKKVHILPSIETLSSNRSVFTILEVVYWVSLFMTFFVLRDLDYVEYNTNNKGGGWAQCFFQFSACVNFVFMYKKKYLQIIISLITTLAVVEVIHVRSFLFFSLMPIIFYYLYSMMKNNIRVKSLIKKIVPLAAVLLLSSVVVTTIRFGKFSLPETELTEIAFNSIDNWSFGYQYFASVAHYLYRFLGPFLNMFSHLGIDRINPLDVYPSVPRLNAMLAYNVTDVSLLENASHMPATIFFDLYISWGYFCGLFAIAVYYYFIKVFDLLHKNLFALVLFSSIIGWHFYMLMRGAIDTCSAGIAYSFWMALLVLLLCNRIKNRTIVRKL